MTVQLAPDQYHSALSLFEGEKGHLIARSCCQGHVPARIFADRAEAPTAAIAVLERFGIAFAAGDAAHAPALLEMLRGWHPWYEVNLPPDSWYPALAAWSSESHATVRYAFANDPTVFDLSRLRTLATPPKGLTLRLYDEALLAQALTETWSEDQQGAFMTADDFMKDGLGVALLENGKLVSGCASFCVHADGYEIQVDTHPDARGKGYATCVCAAFLLETLVKKKVPYWDAANSKSMRLAEKLGFVFERAYPAWILISPKTTTEAVTEKVVGS